MEGQWRGRVFVVGVRRGGRDRWGVEIKGSEERLVEEGRGYAWVSVWTRHVTGAGGRTLHDTRLVDRELQPLLTKNDMRLGCERNAAEQREQLAGRAGHSCEDGRRVLHGGCSGDGVWWAGDLEDRSVIAFP